MGKLLLGQKLFAASCPEQVKSNSELPNLVY